MTQSKPPVPSPRLSRMRDALIADVEAQPFRRRSPRRRTIVGVTSAFVVAGALSGGLTAAAAVTALAPDPAEGLIAATATYALTDATHGTLVGTPVYRTGSGHGVIDLGVPPAGADAVAIGFQCLEPGTFSQKLGDAPSVIPGDCGDDASTAPSTKNPEGQVMGLTSRGDLTYTIDGSARWALWISWGKLPTQAGASSSQVDAVADGQVTRAEYVIAFNRYEACMAQAGFEINAPDNGGTFEYGIPGAGLAVSDTTCYPREFAQVDAIWQTEHPGP
ncbi:hypothetical protein [Frondihabitans cladoniiphilus]|uniref:Uncharacterized protein n=1 Tax=Frondihabitans cladoniiphilus TaxID=715785 RepID=A0ABP8W652_9MICO